MYSLQDLPNNVSRIVKIVHSANFDSKNAGGIGQKVIRDPIKNTMSFFGMIRILRMLLGSFYFFVIALFEVSMDQCGT